ncbi:methylmalonyl-CoA/ethylmalonyl-CoA epimerase [Variovorax boronicumulans]|uniref:VOC family protein n=1 Tax=Variovorax boronicumulans TaxID=436515 RepID=UPI002474F872|nr:VOC family protein [Variovorax boronicumulans]MDH6170995.1 methylmalonyl-CoA/ethylmalonyl-CoA epimerase [Variovorax boronicumulans]
MKQESSASPKNLFRNIDHIAIAVRELEMAIHFFVEVLGFELVRRRQIAGEKTGMIAADLNHNNIKFVLLQGTEPDSQVSKLIKNFGPGIAHIALAVDDIDEVVGELSEQGLKFDTTIISGAGLRQIFTSRDFNSGMSFEFIERSGEENFLDQNVQELFSQLEKKDAY